LAKHLFVASLRHASTSKSFQEKECEGGAIFWGGGGRFLVVCGCAFCFAFCFARVKSKKWLCDLQTKFYWRPQVLWPPP
jgi:hypothetical protein